jgi:hypothetical protein
MKTIRIFISSPGDVAIERDKARKVVEGLQKRYAGRLRLETVLWEDLPLGAVDSFQGGIDVMLKGEQAIDIAVFILWSRLGSPLGAAIRKPDGSAYRSGTEREFDLMLAARTHSADGRPEILVYVRQDDRRFKAALQDAPTNQIEELLRQHKQAEQFIREQFHDAETGSNVRAYHTFPEPNSFAERLKTHLRSLLDAIALDGGLGFGTWEGSPYRGLEVFRSEHAPIFFGRDEEVCEALERLRAQAETGCAFLLLVGASGSGKSSLARAGILPALETDNLDESVAEWRTAALTPGEGTDGLCRALARILLERIPELRSDADSLTDLEEALRDGRGKALTLLLRRACADSSVRGSFRLVLLIDQLEELFTNPAITEAEATAFLAALQALAVSGCVWMLATVRSDFYDRCQRLPTLMALKGERGQMDLLPPKPSDIHRIITGPAVLAGLAFEKSASGESLDQRILNDAVGHPEALPLIEFALAALYDNRNRSGELTFVQYESLGGIEGAIGRHADCVFNALPDNVRAEFGAVFGTLVSLGEQDDTTPVRRRVSMDEVANTSERVQLIGALVNARLLTSDHGALSVAHEALLRRWERLVNWIADHRELLVARKRIIEAERLWQREGRKDEFLLPAGTLLALALSWYGCSNNASDLAVSNYVRKSESIARIAILQHRSRSVWKKGLGWTCLAVSGLMILLACWLTCAGIFDGWDTQIILWCGYSFLLAFTPGVAGICLFASAAREFAVTLVPLVIPSCPCCGQHLPPSAPRCPACLSEPTEEYRLYIKQLGNDLLRVAHRRIKRSLIPAGVLLLISLSVLAIVLWTAHMIDWRNYEWEDVFLCTVETILVIGLTTVSLWLFGSACRMHKGLNEWLLGGDKAGTGKSPFLSGSSNLLSSRMTRLTSVAVAFIAFVGLVLWIANTAHKLGQANRLREKNIMRETAWEWIVDEFLKIRDLSIRVEEAGITPLHVVVEWDISTNLVRRMVQAGISLHSTDGLGNTPLHSATKMGRASSVSVLCSLGANVNARNNDGTSPLMIAAMRGDSEPLSFLLDSGADVMMRDETGRTALHYWGGRSDFCSDSPARIAELLINNGADIDATNNLGQTPLIQACEAGRVKQATEILSLGADARRMDLLGNTAATFAARKKQTAELLPALFGVHTFPLKVSDKRYAGLKASDQVLAEAKLCEALIGIRDGKSEKAIEAAESAHCLLLRADQDLLPLKFRCLLILTVLYLDKGDKHVATTYLDEIISLLRTLVEANSVLKPNFANFLANTLWGYCLDGELKLLASLCDKYVTGFDLGGHPALAIRVAHANLLLGRFEEAREIYLRLSKSDDYPCRFNVQSDFAELRKAGRDHPDMKKIEALLEASPPPVERK